MTDRFILQQSQTHTGEWVCTDRENGIVCRFTEHEFNETQKFTILNDMPRPDVMFLARIMREMSDWLGDNHYNIAMPSIE